MNWGAGSIKLVELEIECQGGEGGIYGNPVSSHHKGSIRLKQ